MIVYIAGKITGNPDYKRDFNQAENDLIVKGHKPLNPAHLPGWLTNAQAMRICMSMIDEADAVLFLSGWTGSKGAFLEHVYCDYTGKTVYLGIGEVPNR